jgi:hypothetical protein
MLLRSGFCPVLIAEVVSDKRGIDKHRMLLQAAVIARLGTVLRNDEDPFVVQAIYLTEELCVERYLAYAGSKVAVYFLCFTYVSK